MTIKFAKQAGVAVASFTSIIAAGMLMAPSALANTTVTVKSGDTLWKIAQAQHTTVAALEKANPALNPSNLQIGAVIKLSQKYTVKAGDSLWKIAHQYGVTVSQLETANPGVNAANLTIGSTVTIPSGSTAPSTPSVKQTTPSYSSTDLYWMEHIIHAEAGSQPTDAKIAVGDVIMHRVASSQYPNTVKNVIFQVSSGHYQFTPVMNGYINSTPTNADKQAALDVLQKHEDIVPGAFVFYTPSKTPASSWVRKQPVIASYGQLTFAK